MVVVQLAAWKVHGCVPDVEAADSAVVREPLGDTPSAPEWSGSPPMRRSALPHARSLYRITTIFPLTLWPAASIV